jgi:hypothetical protein
MFPQQGGGPPWIGQLKNIYCMARAEFQQLFELTHEEGKRQNDRVWDSLEENETEVVVFLIAFFAFHEDRPHSEGFMHVKNQNEISFVRVGSLVRGKTPNKPEHLTSVIILDAHVVAYRNGLPATFNGSLF